MNKDFELFKKTFTRYQNKFGLTGWRISFSHGTLDGAHAEMTPNLSCMVASVRLNSVPHKHDNNWGDIKGHAKHEAIHLLLQRLVTNGSTRYISESEIYESTEEVVRKLENLIE